MATNKKKDAPAPAEATAVTFPIDEKALRSLVKWAEKEERSTNAEHEAERALSEIVRKADYLVTLAGNVHVDGSPIEKERQVKRIERLTESLDKVVSTMTELADA